MIRLPTSARTVTAIALLISQFAMACVVEPGEEISAREPQPVQVPGDDGDPLPVTLLPGSTWSANGDRFYLVRSSARELVLSRVMGDDGSAYLEVHEGQALLAAAEVSASAIVLRVPGGNWLRSTAKALPKREALAMVEPIALTLLDERTIQVFDRALFNHPDRNVRDLSKALSQSGVPVCLPCANLSWSSPGIPPCCCAMQCIGEHGGMSCGIAPPTSGSR